MTPMIMNREAFLLAVMIVTFLVGAIFGYLRGRRAR
jgi:hypothetical protein